MNPPSTANEIPAAPTDAESPLALALAVLDSAIAVAFARHQWPFDQWHDGPNVSGQERRRLMVFRWGRAEHFPTLTLDDGSTVGPGGDRWHLFAELADESELQALERQLLYHPTRPLIRSSTPS